MRLKGRESERARIDLLLSAARAGRSGTLPLRGEPGVGKTALVEYALESARGMTVLRAHGLESEAQLAFSGLAELLAPVLDRLKKVALAQSAALRGALGLGPATAVDRFIVFVAALSLLATVAEEQALLAVIDDWHWLDEASQAAVLFVARRLDREGIAVILASRDTDAASAGDAPLEHLEIRGLPPEACLALLRDLAKSPIAETVAEQLCAATGGNPLAIREIAAQLTPDQLAGEAPLGGHLPAAAHVEASFLARIDRLPTETQQALLVAAASFGATSTIVEACRLLDVSTGAFDPAEEAGLIDRRDGRTTFSHPLLRSAVYNSAVGSVRARVHAALAEALRLQLPDDGHEAGPALERRAWQLAAGATRPDESIAGLVERAAQTARARGAFGAATAGYERAARLTVGRERRAERLVDAAECAQLAGTAEASRELLSTALALSADDRLSGRIHYLRGQVELLQGRCGDACDILESEGTRAERWDEALAALMLADAALASGTLGRLDRAEPLARRAHQLGQRAGGTAAVVGDLTLAGVLVATGKPEEGAELALRHADAVGDGPAPIVMQVIPQVFGALERYDEATTLLDGLIDSARALSAPSLLVPALSIRADVGYRTGDWIAARVDSAEGLRLARETNGNVLYALNYAGQIEAGLGLEHPCREHLGEMIAVGESLGLESVLSYGHAFLGRLALGLGLVDEAVHELEETARLVALHGMREPNWIQQTPDLVEAYVRSGRTGDATTVVDAFTTRANETHRPWALATAARCRALVTDDSSFADEFEEALILHDATPSPFERARTDLCYGERLRRSRRRRLARDHLRTACETFDRLGARGWAARAAAELAASGEQVRRRDSSDVRDLTPHELQLALLVSRGATNKEASAALFISPKTVEAHLHRIYVKLGLRSRTELAHHLVQVGANVDVGGLRL
jgi:DNA-binding CsgD family transcriptional regulator/tetratricopeptide (TPR) repeat protein